jgi:hypothetical protein
VALANILVNNLVSARIDTYLALFFPFSHLLLGFRIIYNHVARLRPLSLDVPHMPSRVEKLHHAHHCGFKRLFGILLANKFHEAKTARLS